MIWRFSHQTICRRGMILMTAAVGVALQTVWAESSDLAEQGQHAFDVGAFSLAADDWQKAVELFHTQGNTSAEIRTSVSLASAFQAVGQHRRAVQILEDSLVHAEKIQDPSLIILTEWKLGAALVMTQEPERASLLLGKALQTARANQDSISSAGILNDFGNSLASEQKFLDALRAYRESVTLSQTNGNLILAAQALCNAASTAAHLGNNEGADDLNTRAIDAADQLEASHVKAFLLLTAGQTDRQIKFTNAEPANRLVLRTHNSFQQALQIAGELKDHPMESYALGYLAQLYEQDGQPQIAL